MARGRPSQPGMASAPPGSRGFTLLELLLVMGVIAAATALSWPALRGPLAQRRLRSAAARVTTELARARLWAIELGRPVEVHWSPPGTALRLVPRPADDEWLAAEVNSQPLEAEAPLAETWQLPRGLTLDRDDGFREGGGAKSTDPGSLAPAPWPEIGPAPGASAPNEWLPVLVFWPDGTAADAAWLVRDERGWQCRITLRGLTGRAQAERPMRREEQPWTAL